MQSGKKCVLVTAEVPSGSDGLTLGDFSDCRLLFFSFAALFSNYSKTLVLKVDYPVLESIKITL